MREVFSNISVSKPDTGPFKTLFLLRASVSPWSKIFGCGAVFASQFIVRFLVDFGGDRYYGSILPRISNHR